MRTPHSSVAVVGIFALLCACPPKPKTELAADTGGPTQSSWLVHPQGSASPDAGGAEAFAPSGVAGLAASPLSSARPDAPPPQRGVLPRGDAQRRLDERADAWFKRKPSTRIYLQLDKPLYQPGETVWVRGVAVMSATLASRLGAHAVQFRLLNPKGAVVAQKRVKGEGASAFTDFELDPGAEGGEYTLQLTREADGASEKRTFIVNAYEAPRFKKTLEFVRKAYGPGDEVAATFEVKRPTGEPYAERDVVGALTLDGVELPRVKARTDGKGACVVKVRLPAGIEKGDGILTVLVEDSGVTESITKRVPIVLNRLALSFFPEGGELVAGLPARVYFAAQNLIGKPADVEGRLVDDHGQTMTTFASVRDGLGRFAFTPATGRSYAVEITRPVGIAERYSLPAAREEGCSLRTFDDPKGAEAAMRVSVACTSARTVVLAAVVREQRVASATAKVEPGQPAVVYLEPKVALQGVARITLFSEDLEPLAERLVYRGWRKDLRVTVKPDRKSYVPRGEVALTVETRDLNGKPVPAELAMAVVDDTVLSFADDKTAHLLARLFLEAEVPDKVEEPNWYFKQDEPEAPVALELLLGTRGWRKFEWRWITSSRTVYDLGLEEAGSKLNGLPVVEAPVPAERAEEAPVRVKERRPTRVMAAMPAPPAAPPPMAPARAAPPEMRAAKPMPLAVAKKKEAFRDEPLGFAGGRAPRGERFGAAMMEERAFDRADVMMVQRPAPLEWAKVRVFPVPPARPDYDGPRTDFRETIYWNPSVRTDARGQAQVRFTLSDAITSFRVTTEGLSSAGLAGRDETVLESKRPFFMDVKIPLEVSAGDRINLPLTLKNESDRELEVALKCSFGGQVKLLEDVAPAKLKLAGGRGQTLLYPLEVVGTGGAAEIACGAQAQGLKDEFKRAVKVVPLGFPRAESWSGTLAGQAVAPRGKLPEPTRETKVLWLKGALPGTVTAKVTLYPSPLATMLTGLESILQEPYGCFEQASSSTYPNIMVMQYLQEHDAAEPAVLERASGLLDRGYRKLTSYETPQKGYEWFGGAPGHEALSAYGLMEFADMRGVYGNVDPEMVKRTAAWLYARRDGTGGFQRNGRALDAFGAASPEVTDAYIVFALTEAGMKDLAPELGAVTAKARASSDPYVVALATRAQLNVAPGGSDGAALAKRLAGMQQPDGRFHGTTHSITRSGGHGLDVETTSLAVLALLKAKGFDAATRKAVGWLAEARGGAGGYGSTQATVLALKALTAYDRASKSMPAGGAVTVRVNGVEVGRARFEKGHRTAIVLEEGLGQAFREGENVVELSLDSSAALPFSVELAYRTNDPASSPEVPLRLATASAKGVVKMGETVRVTATLENTRASGLPMTLVRIGIPGGLAHQTWQLKELVEKKQVDFFETREREVILYFRALAPRAKKELALDLVANVPGSYTAPASAAYLYYTAEQKTWASPLRVQVDGT